MTDLFNSSPKPPVVDPRIKLCARCGKPNAGCGQAGQWFCVEHAPKGFFPRDREGA